MKSTSNQRRLRAHHRRKLRNQFWTAQPEPEPIRPKGRTKSKGAAHVRYRRDLGFHHGCDLNGAPWRSGATWVRKGVK